MVLFNLLTRFVIEDWQKTLDDGQGRELPLPYRGAILNNDIPDSTVSEK
jgi:hypothetical protein